MIELLKEKNGVWERKKINENDKMDDENVDFCEIDFPSSIPSSRRSPERFELFFLHDRLKKLNAKKEIKNVLEFSGGITTWTTYDAIKPEKYICIEEERFSYIFDPVKEIYPDINIIHNWFDIPNIKYDLVFIDGSSCMPQELKDRYGIPDKKSVYRKEALMYSEQYMDIGSLLVFHDWGHPVRTSGWKEPIMYAIESEDYELVEAIKFYRKGFGIFKKIK